VRSNEGFFVDDPDHGEVLLGRERAAPLLGRIEVVRLNPRERDLVAVEEVAQLAAGRVQPVADDDRARR
jgi:hypothetical protein